MRACNGLFDESAFEVHPQCIGCGRYRAFVDVEWEESALPIKPLNAPAWDGRQVACFSRVEVALSDGSPARAHSGEAA